MSLSNAPSASTVDEARRSVEVRLSGSSSSSSPTTFFSKTSEISRGPTSYTFLFVIDATIGVLFVRFSADH